MRKLVVEDERNVHSEVKAASKSRTKKGKLDYDDVFVVNSESKRKNKAPKDYYATPQKDDGYSVNSKPITVRSQPLSDDTEDAYLKTSVRADQADYLNMSQPITNNCGIGCAYCDSYYGT